MRPFSRFLAIAMHPVFMPTLSVWLLFQLDPHITYFLRPEQRWVALAMVAVMTAAFPITSMLMLLRARVIASLEMERREERIAPYGLTLIYYGMAWYLLQRTPLHPAVPAMMAGAFLALFLTALITLRWKISAHMVGIGGLIGAVGGVYYLHDTEVLVTLSFAIVAAGALGTARLIGSDHTLGQVLSGALLGFSCVHATVILAVWGG